MYIMTAPIPEELAAALRPYRQKYDAHAALTPPHISLVPPFVFSGDAETLSTHLHEIGESHAPIKVSVVGWDVHLYQGGFQLRLPLIGGKKEFAALREHILAGPLAYLAQPNRMYWPHIEFGQVSTEVEAAQAKEQLTRFEPKFVFRTTYFELLQRDSESVPWQIHNKFALEATVASSRRRQSTPEPLNLDKLTRK
jgi:hypothetical protein